MKAQLVFINVLPMCPETGFFKVLACTNALWLQHACFIHGEWTLKYTHWPHHEVHLFSCLLMQISNQPLK